MASTTTTYLITGASRGLGLEFVRQLGARPGAVIIATTRTGTGSGASQDVLSRHQVVPLDVCDERSIDALGEQLRGRPIDVLINNAGVGAQAKSVAQLTAEELERVFMVNAFAPLLVAKAVLPNLRAGSRKVIFNITSQLGSIANNTGGSSYAYRASKSALNQLTRSLHHELKGEGFTCVVAHPGWVRTDMGGPSAPITPEESVRQLLGVIEGLTPRESGEFFNFDGGKLPW